MAGSPPPELEVAYRDSEDLENLDFHGINTYTQYSDGTTILSSLLTNAVMAWPKNTDQIPGEETVLTLGSSGSIKFVVNGEDNFANMDIWSTKPGLLADTNALKFSGNHGTWITGGDSESTVKISETTFTFSDRGNYNILDAGSYIEGASTYQRNFRFEASSSDFTGSVTVNGDFSLKGDFMAQSLNVFKLNTARDAVKTGFGFRINDNDGLELYKYKPAVTTPGLTADPMTQRIAVFGEGTVFVDDAHHDFPEYNSEFLTGTPSTAPVQGAGYWSTIGDTNVIYHDTGTVLVGKNTAASSGTYSLEIEGDVLCDSATSITIDEGTYISGDGLSNVDRVIFNNGALSDIIFRGTLSTMVLDEYPPAANIDDSINWSFQNQELTPIYKFDLGLPIVVGNNYSANLSNVEGINKPQLTLGHLFHGNAYKTLSHDQIQNGLNHSINGDYPGTGHFENVFAGMKTVWFDQIQNEVQLSNFAPYSLVDFVDINVSNSLIASNIVLGDSSNADYPCFDGSISTLKGASGKDWDLSNFNDNIVWKDVLTVDHLHIEELMTNIIPDTDIAHDIGTSALRFRNTYSQSNHIGTDALNTTLSTIDLNSENVLHIDNPIQVSKVILSDGSALNSVGLEGDIRTNFKSVSLSMYKDKAYRIKGEVCKKLDRPHTQTTELAKLYIYELSNQNGVIIPNLNTGTYFNDYDASSMKFTLQKGTLIHEQNHDMININLTDESGKKRNKLLVCTHKPDSMNDIIDTNIYLPGTHEFNHKFFVDFNYFHNDILKSVDYREYSQYLPFGHITGEYVVYGKTKYLVTNESGDASNKHLVQYISYFDVPIDDTTGGITVLPSTDYTTPSYEGLSIFAGYDPTNPDNFYYFAPIYVDYRISGIYRYYVKNGLNKDEVYDDDFLLYPKISFRNWKNDRNEVVFEVVPYDEWDLITEVSEGVYSVLPSKIPDTWKMNLFELTFSYIKFGKPGKISQADRAIIEAANTAGIFDDPKSYKIMTRDFNGFEINYAIRLNEELFGVTNIGEITITEIV